MAVKMRLKRIGMKNTPVFRIVVTDGRSPRDGRFIEEIGTYWPLKEGADNFTINLDRTKYWRGVGAQPSETVASIIKRALRAEKGLEPKAKKVKKVKEEPKAEEPEVKAEEPKAEEVVEVAAEPKAEEAAPEVVEEKAEEPAAEEPKAEEVAAEEAAAEGKSEEPVAEEPAKEAEATDEPKAEEKPEEPKSDA
jgi:small subunit ribosomal protein S16